MGFSAGVDSQHLPAARLPPALASQFAQRPRRLAFEHHGDIVPRAIELAIGAAAARVNVEMFGRVPAVGGHVDSAAYGEAIVDDDDLLMMAAAQRMR